MSGTLIAVCGPSGAGKDTVLRLVRASLATQGCVVFARRIITRAAGEDEDNESVTGESFARSLREGAFLLHWQAHGLSYALPVHVLDQLRAGTSVIANVSRGALAALRRLGVPLRIVEITASPGVLASRLAQRGREDGTGQAARLARNALYAGETYADHTIINDGVPEAAAAELTGLLCRVLALQPEKAV